MSKYKLRISNELYVILTDFYVYLEGLRIGRKLFSISTPKWEIIMSQNNELTRNIYIKKHPITHHPLSIAQSKPLVLEN